MANTMTLIASSTAGVGGTAAFDFTSIPSTYTDLCVKLSLRDTSAGNDTGKTWVTFNNNTSSYSEKALYGNGASAGSFSASGANLTLNGNSADSFGNTANTFASLDIYIPNYAGSNYKSVSSDTVSEQNGTTAYSVLDAGLWSNTSAITRITITSNLLYTQYSTAYLYGIKNS
jgi:hypothetical protein